MRSGNTRKNRVYGPNDPKAHRPTDPSTKRPQDRKQPGLRAEEKAEPGL